MLWGRRRYPDEAALALGLSWCMVAYYDTDNRPIPGVVALATTALDMADRVVPSRR